MKLIFFLSILLVVSCTPSSKKAQNDGYTIEGQLANFKDSTLLYLQDITLGKNIDSTYLVNAKFKFTGNVQEPGQFVLQTKFDPKNRDDFKYFFFWIDNSVIKIKGDFENFKYAEVEGSKLHELADELTQQQVHLDKRRVSIVDSIQAQKGDRKKLLTEMHSIDSIRTGVTIDFIRTQPNNPVSLHQLTFINNKFSKKELRKIYDGLDEALKQSTHGIVLKNYISIEKIIEKGDAIIEVEGYTLTGTDVSLSEIIKGNDYTILDFWAAGCGPCRMQSKQYATLYETYKDKGLEIVSFSLDKNRKDWETASKEDTISWVNISDLKGSNATVPMTYGVRGIPNSFLVNKKGIVVAELLGFDTENPPFSKELAKFLK